MKISSKEIKQATTEVFKFGESNSRSIIRAPKNTLCDSFQSQKVYSTATTQNSNTTTLGDVFRAALQKATKGILDTSTKVKEIAQAQLLAKKQAQEAHESLAKVKGIFQEFLQSYGLSDSVEFFIRAKSLDGAGTKIGNKVKKKLKTIQKAANEISTFEVDEILPKIKTTSSPKLKKMHAQLQTMLEKHATDGELSAEQLQKILDPKVFEQKYGKAGLNFLQKTQRKIDKIYAKKTTEGLQAVLKKKASVHSFTTTPAEIATELRDALGIRFVIKKPDMKKISALPVKERAQAINKYMDYQTTQLTSMLMELCQINEAGMKKVTIYGGQNQYVDKKNIQRLQSLGGVDVQESTLASGYTTTQGNLVMGLSQNEKLKNINIEFQIRGEEINKFAEVEHIPYDLREGKDIHFKKYSKEQRQLLVKIQQESRKLNKNEALKASYNDYLSKCYEHYFGKEYGIEVPLPQLPKGLDPVLSQETLFQLAHK